MTDDPKKPEPEILPPTPNKTERSWTPAPKAEAPIMSVGKSFWGRRRAEADERFARAAEALARAQKDLLAAHEDLVQARRRSAEIAQDPDIIGNRVKEQLGQEAHERDLRQRERDLELQEADLRKLEADTLRKEKEAEIARREEALKNPQPPKQKGRRRRQSAEQRANQKFREEMENLKETGFVDDWHAEVKRAEAYFMKVQNVTDPADLKGEFKARLEQMYQAARERKHYKGPT